MLWIHDQRRVSSLIVELDLTSKILKLLDNKIKFKIFCSKVGVSINLIFNGKVNKDSKSVFDITLTVKHIVSVKSSSPSLTALFHFG